MSRLLVDAFNDLLGMNWGSFFSVRGVIRIKVEYHLA